MVSAAREFEELGEAEDWSVARQKLALAYRGAGDLGQAQRFIDVARASGAGDTPMQRVRWSTAQAHILLTDTGTRARGLALLDETIRLPVQCGLSHQLRSIETIRRDNSCRRRRRGEDVTGEHSAVSDAYRADALTIWNYHQMHHRLRLCSAGIGLGSHDLGVATLAAELHRAGLFPVLVFTGANSPTTAARFPRGEAVHYAEHAITLGVPPSAIIIEPEAANTGQNIDFARRALAAAQITVSSVLLILRCPEVSGQSID